MVNDLLFHLIMRPMTRHLFHQQKSLEDLIMTGICRRLLCYSNGWKPRERYYPYRLVEVTLIGLGDGFGGGPLEFRGLRGTDHEGCS
jgi:hypothetical protein